MSRGGTEVKIIAAFLIACGISFAQYFPPGGGGSGTVTSIGLVGTANQITITGASPITGAGSWTVSIPTNPTLPGTTTLSVTTQSANDNSTKAASTAYVDGAIGSAVTTNHGTSRTVSKQSEIYVCTSTCTVTPLTPSEGTQLCVQNDDNVSTVITLAAISGVSYEATARTSYGTANHTATSGGAVKDQICIAGRDATHYNVWSSVGTWTNN